MPRIIESTPEKITTSTSFDGLHVLEFNEKTHRYKLDGNRVPGVTTVGSSYPKGEGLVQWMIKQGIEEYVNKTAMKKGGDIGTVLHTYAEAYERGEEFDVKLIKDSPFEKEICQVIQRFMDWRGTNKDEVLEMESIVASSVHQVGGKIDTLRRRDGLGLVLSDYKSSKDIYITQLLQVIFYRLQYREWKNLDIPYIEIVTFPKLPEHSMHVLLADANGWTKDGVRSEIPGLFGILEAQAIRNLGTFQFIKDVEKILSPPPPYVKKEKGE